MYEKQEGVEWFRLSKQLINIKSFKCDDIYKNNKNNKNIENQGNHEGCQKRNRDTKRQIQVCKNHRILPG